MWISVIKITRSWDRLIFIMGIIILRHFILIRPLGYIKGNSWWRHQMETFSALLAICAGNSPVSGEFPSQRPVTRSFDIFFDPCLNKRLSKQSWGGWFETLSCPLWRQCNVNSSIRCLHVLRNRYYMNAYINAFQTTLNQMLMSLFPQDIVITVLTYWGRDKMTAIFQTTVSNAFSCMKIYWFWLKISLNFIPKGPINDIPALVQIMAWRRPGDKPLSEPMVVALLTHICVTRPQWVKS